MKISILSTSVRQKRNSHRVAQFLHKYLSDNTEHDVNIIDFKELDLPMYEERLRLLDSPDATTKQFAEDIKSSDGIVMVVPEYNGGYPASLKNAIDLLYAEWQNKPIALATVSISATAGSQVMQQLQFILWKIGAWVVPVKFQVGNVESTYEEDGTPTNKENSEKFAKDLRDKLEWAMQAKKKMSQD
ncbi:MAG: NAD(P)H-dependent oxidoreductase [Weeksellaceae bacterium]|nr:NAD(P)H-dependent oxidoreductase [Weeksellaceae bacterium]